MEEEPKYIFRITAHKNSETYEYFVKAFSSNDAIKKVVLPATGNIQISVETICSTLDIIG